MKDPVSNESESSFELMKVFVAFQLFGLFGILITLVTVVFSRSTPRHAAWFSFIISWIISTVAYTLLFWSGHLFSGSEPPFALCLIQGVMIYASPPLTAFTTLALVGQMWYLVHFFEVLFIQTKGKGNQGRPSQKMLIILLVLPYLLFIVIFVGNTILGLQHPSMVKRVSASGMYCTFTNRIPGRISTALCALLLIPVTVLEALICRALRRQCPSFNQAQSVRSMVLRVALFTLVGLISLVFSLIFIFDVHHGGALDVVLSLLPVFAALIFGTQSDVLRAWMFWKKTKPPETKHDHYEKEHPPAKIDGPGLNFIRVEEA
ncbi:hypothetical protein E4T56_gene7379 [Termitomyces sp. T112]|nr:hypothetical protein E4T56_gene7379 [Termitomyces sp. T112]KAH0582060.1 hypothetical protein H2248_011717 [Termitomyces sp. 'cryptogamus']